MLKRHKFLGRKATSAHRKHEHNINRNYNKAKSRVTLLFFCYTKLSSCHCKKFFFFFISFIWKKFIDTRAKQKFASHRQKKQQWRMLFFSCFAGTSSDKDQHILNILMGNQVSKQKKQNETLNGEMIWTTVRWKKVYWR